LADHGAGGADVSFFGQIRFPNEVYSQFDSGFPITVSSTGRDHRIEGDIEHPGTVQTRPRRKKYILTRAEHTETIKIRAPSLYIGEVEDMADAILLGKAPRISLADSRNIRL